MTKEPTTVEKLRGLRWSIALNAANTVFVQFTYFDTCEFINTAVCQECATRLAEFGDTRQEYIILAIHALHECLGRSS